MFNMDKADWIILVGFCLIVITSYSKGFNDGQSRNTTQIELLDQQIESPSP